MSFKKLCMLVFVVLVAGCPKKPVKPCDLSTGEWCTFPDKVEIEVTKPVMPDVDPTKIDDPSDPKN